MVSELRGESAEWFLGSACWSMVVQHREVLLLGRLSGAESYGSRESTAALMPAPDSARECRKALETGRERLFLGSGSPHEGVPAHVRTGVTPAASFCENKGGRLQRRKPPDAGSGAPSSEGLSHEQVLQRHHEARGRAVGALTAARLRPLGWTPPSTGGDGRLRRGAHFAPETARRRGARALRYGASAGKPRHLAASS